MAIRFNSDALRMFSNANFRQTDAIANLNEGKDGLVQKGTRGLGLLAKFRSGKTEDRNNAVRTELLISLGNAFRLTGFGMHEGKTTFTAGFMDELEKLLGSAIFKRDDFGIDENGEVKSGKPLTQRRITAIVNAASAKGAAAAEPPLDCKTYRRKVDSILDVLKKDYNLKSSRASQTYDFFDKSIRSAIELLENDFDNAFDDDGELRQMPMLDDFVSCINDYICSKTSLRLGVDLIKDFMVNHKDKSTKDKICAAKDFVREQLEKLVTTTVDTYLKGLKNDEYEACKGMEMAFIKYKTQIGSDQFVHFMDKMKIYCEQLKKYNLDEDDLIAEEKDGGKFDGFEIEENGSNDESKIIEINDHSRVSGDFRKYSDDEIEYIEVKDPPKPSNFVGEVKPEVKPEEDDKKPEIKIVEEKKPEVKVNGNIKPEAKPVDEKELANTLKKLYPPAKGYFKNFTFDIAKATVDAAKGQVNLEDLREISDEEFSDLFKKSKQVDTSHLINMASSKYSKTVGALRDFWDEASKKFDLLYPADKSKDTPIMREIKKNLFMNLSVVNTDRGVVSGAAFGLRKWNSYLVYEYGQGDKLNVLYPGFILKATRMDIRQPIIRNGSLV